jgi:hypothetical protein
VNATDIAPVVVVTLCGGPASAQTHIWPVPGSVKFGGSLMSETVHARPLCRVKVVELAVDMF